MKTRKEIAVLLHNIRSTHNVGSIFRTADALGISKIYISGYTPTPLDKFNKKKFEVVALEQGESSVDYKKVKVSKKVLFIVGNEVDGIEKRILKLCDVVAEVPMNGKKESLNVSVAFGVALFRILNI